MWHDLVSQMVSAGFSPGEAVIMAGLGVAMRLTQKRLAAVEANLKTVTTNVIDLEEKVKQWNITRRTITRG